MASAIRKRDFAVVFAGAAVATGIYAASTAPVETIQTAGSLFVGKTDDCVTAEPMNAAGQTVYRNTCQAPVNASVCTRTPDRNEHAVVVKLDGMSSATRGAFVQGKWTCGINKYDAGAEFARSSRDKSLPDAVQAVTVSACVAPRSPGYAFFILPVCKDKFEGFNSSVLVPARPLYSLSR